MGQGKSNKGQMSIEYVFAAFMWIIICSLIAYAVNWPLSAFTSQNLMRSYSAVSGSISSIADSDVDGMRYLYGHYRVEGNFSFNNTSASLQVGGEEYIASSAANYTYSDLLQRGDKLLLKNQDGKALAVKVG